MRTHRLSCSRTLIFSFLLLLNCSFAAHLGWTAEPSTLARLETKAQEQPNVILILVDDLGWRDWSGAGNEICLTPNIDQLAAEGISFTQAYAACAVCSPTRAAVQTGRYPARVGVTDWIRSQFQRPGGTTPEANPTEYVGGPQQPLLCPPNPFWMVREELTLAELLRGQKSYRTAYIGKWHLGDEPWYPEHQGFEVNHGGCDYGQPPNYFDPFNQPKGRHASLQAGIYNLPGQRDGHYLTDRETEEACKLIRLWRDEPFFIQLSHYAVHTPLQAPEPDTAKYLRDGVSKRQATYAAMVESVDRGLGEIRRTLAATGLDRNTIIWFTSDNGGLDTNGTPTENLPLRAGKGFPYEGGIRVPNIIHYSSKIPASTSAAPMSSIDILPTIAEWAGATVPSDRVIDGISLAAHATSGGKAKLPERDLLWHFPHYRGGTQPYAILRRGPWKLLHYFGDHDELYNLEADPGEAEDRAAMEPDRVATLRASLLEQLYDMNAKLPRPNPNFRAAK